jgi:nucleotide-binding universal stress UspA family protein
MGYSALMVYVDAEGASELRVRIAADLAARFDAALIGLSALAMPKPFVAEGVIIEEATEADVAGMRARLAKKGEWFRATVGPKVSDVEWRAVLDFPDSALAREARSADLVIAGLAGHPHDPYRYLDPRAMLLKLGRPLLVIPEGIAEVRTGHVVVGWKDTREARRAVRDALPLLKLAQRVSVVSVTASEATTAEASICIDDVARYLARHRIAAEARVIRHSEKSYAGDLLQFAEDQQGDLLVVGAYGHSRLGEWAFGGLTRDLLNTGSIPCLMAH